MDARGLVAMEPVELAAWMNNEVGLPQYAAELIKRIDGPVEQRIDGRRLLGLVRRNELGVLGVRDEADRVKIRCVARVVPWRGCRGAARGKLGAREALGVEQVRGSIRAHAAPRLQARGAAGDPSRAAANAQLACERIPSPLRHSQKHAHAVSRS